MVVRLADYVDKLDEAVNDRKLVVTYKWLCQNADPPVSSNEAKQLLYQFAKQSKTRRQPLNVTYVLAGVKLSPDKVQIHSVCLVPASRLDEMKERFAKLTAIHVYSVQTMAVPDADSHLVADSCASLSLDIKRVSAISCDMAALKSDVHLNPADVEVHRPEAAPPRKVESVRTSVSQRRTTTTNSLANMLTSQGNRTKTKDNKNILSQIEENGTAAMSNGHHGRGTSEAKLQAVEESNKRNKIGRSFGTKSKTAGKELPAKRRKRIVVVAESSSSSSEGENDEEAVPAVVEKISSPDSSANENVSATGEPSRSSGGGGGGGQYVEDTVMDDDGYLQTRKRWVADTSSAASSVEASTRQGSLATSKIPPPRSAGKAKRDQGTSAHKQQQQARLTSFFKPK